MQVERIYGIYDLKAERVIGNLFLQPSDLAAIRMFEGAIADVDSRTGGPGNAIAQHPNDYAVAFFGTLAPDDTGSLRITAADRPLDSWVITGFQVVNKVPTPVDDVISPSLSIAQ